MKTLIIITATLAISAILLGIFYLKESPSEILPSTVCRDELRIALASVNRYAQCMESILDSTYKPK